MTANERTNERTNEQKIEVNFGLGCRKPTFPEELNFVVHGTLTFTINGTSFLFLCCLSVVPVTLSNSCWWFVIIMLLSSLVSVIWQRGIQYIFQERAQTNAMWTKSGHILYLSSALLSSSSLFF